MCYGMKNHKGERCPYEDRFTGDCKKNGRNIPEDGVCQQEDSYECEQCGYEMDMEEEQCPICGSEDIVEV